MRQAFFYAIASALAFSIMNLFVKMLGQAMPAAEITFFRGLIGTVAVLIYMRVKGIAFSTENRGMLTVRGIFGGLGNLCNFIALAYMKLADAAILFQLKESVPKGAGKWLLLILAAVCLMIKPWSFSEFHWYSLYAIAGAAFAAAAYTTIRKLSQVGHHSNYEIMFYFLVTTMIVGGILMGPDFVWPDLRQWVILGIIGGISVFAQFFLTGAFVATNAVVAQFLQYIGVFFNAMWGFVIFDETLSWLTVLAGIMMFVASVMIARLKEQHVKV